MFTTLPVQRPNLIAPQDSPQSVLREIQPVTLIEDVVPQVTPPMEFRKWLELVKSYAEAANRRQQIMDGGSIDA